MEKTKQIFENRIINLKDNNFDIDKQPFWVQDIYESIKDEHDIITSMTSIFIPENERLSGKGSKLIQDYIKENIKEDKLYFAITGVSCVEYTEDEYNNMDQPIIDMIFFILEKFYTKNCFININSIVQSYENHEIYLYLNQAGFKLLRKLMSNNQQISYPKFPKNGDIEWMIKDGN